MEQVFSYFRNTQKYSTVRFILELTLLAFTLKMLFIILFGSLFTMLGINIETSDVFERELVSYGWISAFILVILFAAFETLTGQWFVIWLTAKITRSNRIKILASATVFALLHVEPMLIAAVWPIGIILAWSFLSKSKKSKLEAFWVTTTIHVLHNAFVLFLVWLSTG